MSGEKTEKPTARRKKDLRKKGVHARSTELPQAIALLVLVVAIPMAIHGLITAYRWDMASILGSAGTTDLTTAGQLARQMVVDGAKALVLPIVLVMAASMLASHAVTRERPSLAALRPKVSHLNPKLGVKRVFGVQGLADATRALLKLSTLIGVGFMSWRAGITKVTSNNAGVDADLAIVGSTAASLLLKVAAVSLLVGVIDAAWARRRYGKQAKMSKNEVRDETKQQELNAQVRGAIRSKQFALSRSRMIQAVERADVVLANPTHLVVALSYEPGTAAPVVLAKGAGAIAQRIKDEAARHSVPVIENKPLARAIYSATEIGDVIPPELFRAVAQVLAAIYATRKRKGQPLYRAAGKQPPRGAPGRSRRRRARTLADVSRSTA